VVLGQSGRTKTAFIGLVLLAGVAGCGRHGKEAPQGGSTIPPSQVKLKRNVELIQAGQRPVTYHVETVGYLEAEGQTNIAAGVSGIVDEVLFREGQWVDKNTILVKVNQRTYSAALKLAEATVQRAQASLELAQKMDRIAQGAGSGVSREEKTKTEQAVKVAEAELEVARAAFDQAKTNFDHSQVRAPYPGQINQRMVTPGSHLKDETVIATMADLRRYRLVGWVPEKAAPTVRKLLKQEEQRRDVRLAGACLGRPCPWTGLAALVLDAHGLPPVGYGMEFMLPAFPERAFKKDPREPGPGPFTGRIFYMSRVASPDTHLFECKAEVDLSGLEDELQETGYSARIRIPLKSNPKACTVPEEAVKASERGYIAFVPVSRAGKDGQQEWFAELREVELGYRADGWVEVLPGGKSGQGLRVGEWIVGKGAEALENGTPIQFPEDQLQRMKKVVSSQ
jgi:multidrug efflux system membrane fusion protein